MPYAPDTPATTNKPVITPASQDVDEFHITEMLIKLKPGDMAATVIDVTWVEGYDDSGSFIPVETKRATLQGQTLIDQLTANTANPSQPRWDEIKDATWNLLKTEGHITSGTIS